MNVMQERPITLQSVAQRFGVTLKTVYCWAAGTSGKRLETVKVGGRRMTTEEAVNRFASADQQQQPSFAATSGNDYDASMKALKELHGF